MKREHKMPFGAECLEDGSVSFRLWAPEAKQVEILLNGAKKIRLEQKQDGWFELITAEAGAGTRYQYQIDGAQKVSDPASRFQPEDVHGLSEIVNPAAFEWSDENWRGRPWEEAVIYELHVGTFSPEGTFAGV